MWGKGGANKVTQTCVHSFQLHQIEETSFIGRNYVCTNLHSSIRICWCFCKHWILFSVAYEESTFKKEKSSFPSNPSWNRLKWVSLDSFELWSQNSLTCAARIQPVFQHGYQSCICSINTCWMPVTCQALCRTQRKTAATQLNRTPLSRNL